MPWPAAGEGAQPVFCTTLQVSNGSPFLQSPGRGLCLVVPKLKQNVSKGSWGSQGAGPGSNCSCSSSQHLVYIAAMVPQPLVTCSLTSCTSASPVCRASWGWDLSLHHPSTYRLPGLKDDSQQGGDYTPPCCCSHTHLAANHPLPNNNETFRNFWGKLGPCTRTALGPLEAAAGKTLTPQICCQGLKRVKPPSDLREQPNMLGQEVVQASCS